MVAVDAATVAALIRVAFAAQSVVTDPLPSALLVTEADLRLVLLDNRRLFVVCGFVETTRDTHPGYAEPTFVNMERRLTAPGKP